MTFKFQGKILKNEWLSRWVYYRIGGPADEFYIPHSEKDILNFLDSMSETNESYSVLGSGTNLLVRDGGIRGKVLYLGPHIPSEIKILEEKDAAIHLRVPSFFSKAKLLETALKNLWGGLEFSAGIPGTMGGAVFMNAGTKWGSYGDVITSVRLYVPGVGIVSKTKYEMGFKYRGHGEGLLSNGAVVLSVDLKLAKSSKKEIFPKVDEILAYRGLRQPLELPNCGSVFKNPQNSEKGAGRLIEACDLKGLRIGQAQFSKKHANFILNLGGAKSSDVESLIEIAQTRVQEKFEILLEPEVIVLGIKNLN